MKTTNSTVKKGELTKRVAGIITDLNVKDVDWIISEFITQLARDIKTGVRVQIHGLGTFETHPVKARKGRHPGTGEAIDIPAGHRIGFRPCGALKDK